MKYQEKEQLKLWADIREGSHVAFDKLYKYYVQMLFNYGMKINADRQLVQDCIQELFINLWRNRERLNLKYSVKHYLLISLRNLIFRKQQKTKLISLRENFDDFEKETRLSGNEVQTFKNKKIQTIKGLIQALPKRQREALFLKYFEQLSYEEIASIMSIQITAVYKLTSQAIKNLRKQLS